MGARITGTNFGRANLTHADLRGTDLRAALGLTSQQIEGAETDAATLLPSYLN
jgi:uncharacterized protein YjbI with pentapeptide repeats